MKFSDTGILSPALQKQVELKVDASVTLNPVDVEGEINVYVGILSYDFSANWTVAE